MSGEDVCVHGGQPDTHPPKPTMPPRATVRFPIQYFENMEQSLKKEKKNVFKHHEIQKTVFIIGSNSLISFGDNTRTILFLISS
jgi:hypothetical protein